MTQKYRTSPDEPPKEARRTPVRHDDPKGMSELNPCAEGEKFAPKGGKFAIVHRENTCLNRCERRKMRKCLKRRRCYDQLVGAVL